MLDDADAAEFAGVVVAAGRSMRFGGSTPKQFQMLAGRSVMQRSVDLLAAHPAVTRIVVVVARDRLESPEVEDLRRRCDGLTVVEGGATRSESVRAGLAGLDTQRFVLVHDAARPLASPALVDAVVRATREAGAAVPGLTVPDTVKRVRTHPRAGDGNWVLETVDRNQFRLAQTPQGARVDWLREALDDARAEGTDVTDEAAALERAGRKVRLVEGEARNRKITSTEDLLEARRLLEPPGEDLRVGIGFDIHRFGDGRRLVLGGVEFPGEQGLAGHSDADVVLHAAMDALLGAICLGDIGMLFPPEDPQYAGADSRDLAREVARRLDQQGFGVINLDIALMAERPRIRARAEEMRRSIGQALDVAFERVGLKATTLEKLGALGRGEGIACQAVALVSRRTRS